MLTQKQQLLVRDPSLIYRIDDLRRMGVTKADLRAVSFHIQQTAPRVTIKDVTNLAIALQGIESAIKGIQADFNALNMLATTAASARPM